MFGLSLANVRFHPNNSVRVFIQLVQSHIGVEISSPACFKLGFTISAVREVLILSRVGLLHRWCVRLQPSTPPVQQTC
jgi:hypothetical protein